ncbi:MAG TPA: S-methyl-5-thioribose-1-phosphate isomerase, partial [candidate division Zixibacteria bacterium]|nr:S-methyl-5-thioribose-1-phosphate isomerase [candidate division Zixibacteria bacterium]
MELDFMKLQPAIEPIHYSDGVLRALDQRRLPHEEVWLELRTLDEVIDAIKTLAVRGAPLLGIVAGYGVLVGMHEIIRDGRRLTGEEFDKIIARIAGSRPTARNLFDTLEKMHATFDNSSSDECNILKASDLAKSIHDTERGNCIEIARNSLGLLRGNVITHCNTGVLATGGIGTALGAIQAGYSAGLVEKVWVDETRPLLQGARLTAWELGRLDIPHEIICDGAVAGIMAEGLADCAIVGADRIASNGDTANKIGTYGLAVLCDYHELPFYIAAPGSTFDLSL